MLILQPVARHDTYPTGRASAPRWTVPGLPGHPGFPDRKMSASQIPDSGVTWVESPYGQEFQCPVHRKILKKW